jgi:hypothetical protein
MRILLYVYVGYATVLEPRRVTESLRQFCQQSGTVDSGLEIDDGGGASQRDGTAEELGCFAESQMEQ